MINPKVLGLIGYPLSHSFSVGYFADKFEREHITNFSYQNFPLERIEEVLTLFESGVQGLNVTIPYKEQIIPYLDRLDPISSSIQAVNTIYFGENEIVGYNTDVFGFEESLKPLLRPDDTTALILGTGGASKAVAYVLDRLDIRWKYVSRNPTPDHWTYPDITADLIAEYKLIINTTPLGMHPNLEQFPPIPYSALSSEHLLYDLIYNPEKTLFLTKGEKQQARIKNGLEMLILQAEKSWEIWTSI